MTLLTTQDAPPARIDVLLVRVPKSLALLEDQLYRLAPHVHAGTVVVGTGMVKEIHTSTLRLFEKILGPTKTSLAEKKARLIFCTPGTPGATRPESAGPWPVTYTVDEDGGSGAGLTVVNHAGIFCADRLDVGTRFFLQNIPTNTDGARVVDLGCGNGVVGTAVAVADPDAAVVFTDESYQAVASARATYEANVPQGLMDGGVPRRRRGRDAGSGFGGPGAVQSALPLAPGDDGRDGAADVRAVAQGAPHGRGAVGGGQPSHGLPHAPAAAVRQQRSRRERA